MRTGGYFIIPRLKVLINTHWSFGWRPWIASVLLKETDVRCLYHMQRKQKHLKYLILYNFTFDSF